MSEEENHIRIINHWRQYGEREKQYHKKGEWRLESKRMISKPEWNFETHNYRVPQKYKGPWGFMVWDEPKQEYYFEPDKEGNVAKRETIEKHFSTEAIKELEVFVL